MQPLLILDSDRLLFVIVNVLKYSNQSGDSLSFGKSNPLEARRFKRYSKTSIVCSHVSATEMKMTQR